MLLSPFQRHQHSVHRHPPRGVVLQQLYSPLPVRPIQWHDRLEPTHIHLLRLLPPLPNQIRPAHVCHSHVGPVLHVVPDILQAPRGDVGELGGGPDGEKPRHELIAVLCFIPVPPRGALAAVELHLEVGAADGGDVIEAAVVTGEVVGAGGVYVIQLPERADAKDVKQLVECDVPKESVGNEIFHVRAIELDDPRVGSPEPVDEIDRRRTRPPQDASRPVDRRR
mmetsp:Transcript_15203/g.40944  ORF Transcript_15203/g.40944 Transcript_15203/m.40944 type:complete len:224 (+) Transcript_15203:298-969(+)